MARRHLIHVISFTLLLALGMGPAIGQESELADEQVLRVGSPDDDITGLDPMYFLGTSGEPMARAMFEGLVRFNYGNVSPDAMEPALAESWTTSDDGRTWTFQLREGVQFHQGYGEFTSEDVVYSIERHINNESRHAGDYSNVEEINALGPYTVEFALEEPDAFFLFTVGNFHGGYIVSKRAVEDKGQDAFRSSPVGTGPFQFGEWTPQDSVVLEPHAEYWGGSPILERIEFRFMPDDNTRTLALQQGEIDTTTSGLDEEDWIQRMRAQDVIVDTLGFDIPMLLHFNMTVEPLDDHTVRRALAHATNREDFLAYHGPSITQVQQSVLPPGMYGAITPEEGLPTYEYDPQLAQELLAEAGYPDGFHIGTVLSSVRSLYLDPLEIIQGQWSEIGVTFDIRTLAHNEYHERIRDDASPMVGYPGPRPTPDMIFRQYLHSESIVGKETAITNFSHYGDVDADGDGEIDSVDELIDEAVASTDPERQRELYAEAQIQVLEDLPVLPLRVTAAVQARRSWVDLGHEPYEGSYMNGYTYTENTRILAH